MHKSLFTDTQGSDSSNQNWKYHIRIWHMECALQVESAWWIIQIEVFTPRVEDLVVLRSIHTLLQLLYNWYIDHFLQQLTVPQVKIILTSLQSQNM